MGILQEESKLIEIVKLIGSDILPDEQKLILKLQGYKAWFSTTGCLSSCRYICTYGKTVCHDGYYSVFVQPGK